MLSRETQLEERLAKTKILIVDDYHHIRKVVRTMLAGIGIRNVEEAPDGAAGLAALPVFDPDIVIVDWDMPLLNGLEFIRLVRMPGASTHADVPIIMLTAHNESWRVIEAARYGVHEFLIKPVSTKNLRDRIVGILERPRAMMQIQDTYVPVPRKVVVLDERLNGPPRQVALKS
jgi:DNA-binding response OmpR family regulator